MRQTGTEIDPMNEQKCVLLADDSRFLRLTYERVLVKAGYRVIAAADGEQAVMLAQRESPDLIVLDMLLPKVSGPEVLRTLRRDPRTAGTPIVVLSSLPQSNEHKLRMEGATVFRSKATLNLQNNAQGLVHILDEAFQRQAAENRQVCSDRVKAECNARATK